MSEGPTKITQDAKQMRRQTKKPGTLRQSIKETTTKNIVQKK
jgi:hypothetical protein